MDIFGFLLYGASYICTWKYTVLAFPFEKDQEDCRKSTARAALGSFIILRSRKGCGKPLSFPFTLDREWPSGRIYTWSRSGQARAPTAEALRSPHWIDGLSRWWAGDYLRLPAMQTRCLEQNNKAKCPKIPQTQPQASPSESGDMGKAWRRTLNQKVFQAAERLGQSGPLPEGTLLLGEGGCGFPKRPWASRALSVTSGCPLETRSLFQSDKLLGSRLNCTHLGIGCLGADPGGGACRVLGVGEPLGASFLSL